FVPDNDYIAQIYNVHHISDLNSMCLIQLNLSLNPTEVKIEGRSPRGMNTQVSYLDSEGNFYEVPGGLTRNIFILGQLGQNINNNQQNQRSDNEGVINLKIKYDNGLTDFVQSYCSENTYFVEQL